MKAQLPEALSNVANINPYRWVSLRERAMLSEGKSIVRKAECYAERFPQTVNLKLAS